MDKSTENRLNDILDGVFFHSPEEYAIGGQRFPVSGLNDFLYNWCYSRELRLPLGLSMGNADPADSLIIDLAAANGTRERWDYGWKITQLLQDGSFYAQKEAQSRLLRQGEYQPLDPWFLRQPASGSGRSLRRTTRGRSPASISCMPRSRRRSRISKHWCGCTGISMRRARLCCSGW